MDNVTDDTFQAEILESKIPVVLDFWAPWCGPCRMMQPILDDLERTYQGKFRIVKINLDENPKTAIKYGVRSIPTLIHFDGGFEKFRLVGAAPKARIVHDLQLNGPPPPEEE